MFGALEDTALSKCFEVRWWSLVQQGHLGTPAPNGSVDSSWRHPSVFSRHSREHEIWVGGRLACFYQSKIKSEKGPEKCKCLQGPSEFLPRTQCLYQIRVWARCRPRVRAPRYPCTHGGACVCSWSWLAEAWGRTAVYPSHGRKGKK